VNAADVRVAHRGIGVTTELVERAQRGDHEAFDALAAAAYHRLYAIARRILRDGYAAEDAVQDTLVRAWRDLRSLRDRDRFDAWLHRLLVHACADQVRRRRRSPLTVAIDSIERPDPGDDFDRVVDRDQIERAFLELSVEHRAVLVLTQYVGLPAPEVAAILGVPVGTVYSRIHHGTKAMRASLMRTTGVSDQPSPEHGR
jgi:RNA polymerase sigma-70 factor (ECF subfamily)